jgi:hypothetical protein
MIAFVASVTLIKTRELSVGLKVLIALIPVPAFAAFIVSEIRMLRRCDELQQRVQLEALAVAYPTAILLVFGFGLLERAGVVVPGFENMRDVWPLTVLPYFIGLWIARRRYR